MPDVYCQQPTPVGWTLVSREGDALCGRGMAATCGKKEPTPFKLTRHQASQACFSTAGKTGSGKQRAADPYIGIFDTSVRKFTEEQDKFDKTGEGFDHRIAYGGDKRGWLITQELLETTELRPAYKKTLAAATQLRNAVAGDGGNQWRGFVLAGEFAAVRSTPRCLGH